MESIWADVFVVEFGGESRNGFDRPSAREELRLLRTVAAAGLLSSVHTERIAATADDLVANPWQVTHSTTTDQNDRVLLEVVPFTRNINRDFFAVAQTHPGDFSESRVRLLWGHRTNDQANALLLRASLKHGAFGGFTLNYAVATNQLIDGWHTIPVGGILEKTAKMSFSTKGGSRTHTSLRTQDFESSASAIPPLWHYFHRYD